MTPPHLSRRSLSASAATIGLSATAVPTASASGAAQSSVSLRLSDGFAPEGITIQNGIACFGSRVTGDIYRMDTSTGEGYMLAEGPGTPSLGLKIYDGEGRVFIAGGSGGDGRVVLRDDGELLGSFGFGGGFVNDVLVVDTWRTSPTPTTPSCTSCPTPASIPR
jgi:hypothetical protein